MSNPKKEYRFLVDVQLHKKNLLDRTFRKYSGRIGTITERRIDKRGCVRCEVQTTTDIGTWNIEATRAFIAQCLLLNKHKQGNRVKWKDGRIRILWGNGDVTLWPEK